MAGNYQVILNDEVVGKIIDCIKKSAYEAVQDMRIDIDQAQTVPFLTGTLDDSAHVTNSENAIELHYSAPYALVQYYVPMKHYTGQHANATDHWMDPYIPGRGSKGNFIAAKTAEHLQQNMEEEFGND